MRKLRWNKPVIMLVVMAMLALTLALTTLPVFAATPSLTVTNAILVQNVTPGQTITWPMTVSNPSADPATVITVRVEGMTQGSDGSLETLPAAQDTGPYTARPFITLDQNSLP